MRTVRALRPRASCMEPSRSNSRSSLSLYFLCAFCRPTIYFLCLKVIAFLEWAATRPQPLVGLADDDVFISLPMLAATARLLAGRMQHDAEWRHLCVGSMEW
eukprot:scaffold31812_cov58-Phaeocystis_antarctica.AAC.7